MPIQGAAKRQQLADAYASDITHVGLATASPGTPPTVANELSGAGPEGTYARVTISSTAGTGGIRNFANGTLHAPATGSNYNITHLLLCTGATGNTMVDHAPLTTPIPIGPQGGVVTLSGVKYTQT